MAGSCLLSSTQLQRLCQQKSQCKVLGRSLLLPILEPIWRLVAQQLPRWVTPGLLTLIGCFVATAFCMPTLCLLPEAEGQGQDKVWPLLLSSLGILWYMITNVICGRQNVSPYDTSPIDQVIDCCCASVFNFIMCLSALCAVRLTDHAGYMVIFMFNAYVVFHLRHWETYVNGKVFIGKIHTPEVQLCVMLVHLLTAAFGSKIWLYEVIAIPYLGRVLLWHCWYLSVMMASFQFCRIRFATILDGGVGKNGSSIAETSVLSPGFPVAVILALALYLYRHSKGQALQTHPVLSHLVFCPCLAKISGKLQLSLITKHPVEKTDIIMMGPMALVIVSYFKIPVDEYMVLVACLVFCWINLIFYTTRICTEISRHLNISVFVIDKKVE